MPFYYNSDNPSNAWVRFWRRAYKPLGFTKGYNFPLWIILGGAMLGFGLARAMYLDIGGIFAQAKIINGDWRYYSHGHYYVGIIMHLACVIPAAILVPWQFVPIIRHKAILFHKINGYLLITLLLVGNAGAFMIARHSMGGGLDAQGLIGILGISTTGSLALAYINIKRLQIDQHRAWMLRAWIYAGSIITLRLIQAPAFVLASKMGSYYWAMPCETIDYITSFYGPSQVSTYPACREDPMGYAAVNVNFFGAARINEIGASIDITFGMAGMLAFFLHALGVEIYLHLTPAEARRLRRVSYERQLAKGYKHPGSAGLTADRLGDDIPFEQLMQEKDHAEKMLRGDSSSDSDLDSPLVAQPVKASSQV